MDTPSDARALPQEWLGAMCSHEGAPLALRVRARASSWRGRRETPYLLAVTLHLAEVRSDGMPVPDYNDSLLDLDLAVTRRFEQDGDAVVVLIETISGQRTWYAYSRTKHTGEEMLRDIDARFPGHRFLFRAKTDAEWRLWETYHELFRSSVAGDW